MDHKKGQWHCGIPGMKWRSPANQQNPPNTRAELQMEAPILAAGHCDPDKPPLHHPQLEMPNGNTEEGTSQERPGIRYGDFGFSSAYDSYCSSSSFLCHLLHPFFLLSPFFLSLFSLYLSNFSFFFLFLFPFLSLLLSFLRLSSLSLTKHPSHNHAGPGFLLGFGKHRDKFVAETCLYPF